MLCKADNTEGVLALCYSSDGTCSCLGERFWTSKSIGFEGVGGRFREKRSKKVFTAEARGGPWQTVYSGPRNRREALSPPQCRAWPPGSDEVCSPTSPPAHNLKSRRTNSKRLRCWLTLVTQFGFFRLWLRSLPYLPLSPVASMLQMECK